MKLSVDVKQQLPVASLLFPVQCIAGIAISYHHTAIAIDEEKNIIIGFE
jgi:hypothetical protein